jgi:hypothetical protein
MTKRRATLLVLSLLCIALISIWLLSARIANLVMPSLLNSSGIRIESLQIASVGFRSIEITHLSGQTRLPMGIVIYDIKNASVSYGLLPMRLRRVEIERSVVDYWPEPSESPTVTRQLGDFTSLLPLEGSIGQFQFNYDGADEISGRMDVSVSGRKGRIAFSDAVAVTPIGFSADTFTSNFTLVNGSPLIVEGQVDVTEIKSGGWRELPGVNLEGEWTWNDGSFKSSGTTSWGGLPNASWSVVSHTNEEIRVDFKAALAELFQDLKNNPDMVPIGLEFSEGKIEVSFQSIWSTGHYDNQLQILGTGASGQMGSLEFFDGLLKFDSTDPFMPTFSFEISKPIIKLANGIDVTDLRVSGRWQDGLHLDHTEMSVLGGTVNVEPAFLDVNSTTHEISLQVVDIELEQILSMVGRDGLLGSGKLSGNLPILYIDSSVAIDEGRLSNTTKGHISYKIGAEASSRLSNIAIKALQDFHYDVLDATLTYQVDGDYTILVRLEGRNPELYDGFPVAFNIDLSGSLPELLQASLVSRDFHREILRYIQKKRGG